jgi:hypothetical protein
LYSSAGLVIHPNFSRSDVGAKNNDIRLLREQRYHDVAEILNEIKYLGSLAKLDKGLGPRWRRRDDEP